MEARTGLEVGLIGGSATFDADWLLKIWCRGSGMLVLASTYSNLGEVKSTQLR